jgi:thiol-disulfide isomerase/thioredoxin
MMKALLRLAPLACVAIASAAAQDLVLPLGTERTAGVGMALGVSDGHIRVMQVMPDSPAALSGQIGENDRVLAVGEGEEPSVSLEGKTITECVALIRGEAGTKVRITVLPEKASPSAAREVILTRDELNNPLGLALDATLLNPGTDAPELRYTRLEDGKDASLKLAHRGRVVVLEFWATWCGPCQEAMTAMQALAAKNEGHKDKLAFLTISIDGDAGGAPDPAAMAAKVAAHAKSKKWNRTTNGWSAIEGRRDWYVGSLPTTYVIGADGKIIAANPTAEKLRRSSHPRSSPDPCAALCVTAAV